MLNKNYFNLGARISKRYGQTGSDEYKRTFGESTSCLQLSTTENQLY